MCLTNFSCWTTFADGQSMNLLYFVFLIICYNKLFTVMGIHERALVENLLEHYHTGLRPVVENSSQATSVNISLRLVQIFEMVSPSKKNRHVYRANNCTFSETVLYSLTFTKVKNYLGSTIIFVCFGGWHYWVKGLQYNSVPSI